MIIEGYQSEYPVEENLVSMALENTSIDYIDICRQVGRLDIRDSLVLPTIDNVSKYNPI